MLHFLHDKMPTFKVRIFWSTLHANVIQKREDVCDMVFCITCIFAYIFQKSKMIISSNIKVHYFISAYIRSFNKIKNQIPTYMQYIIHWLFKQIEGQDEENSNIGVLAGVVVSVLALFIIAVIVFVVVFKR